MKIKRIIKLGQFGTKKLVAQFGDNFICVRYIYDSENGRTLKTIELIVESTPWQPNVKRIPMNKVVDLRIARNEIELRHRVKRVSGKWNPQKHVWQLAYKKVLELDLAERIVA